MQSQINVLPENVWKSQILWALSAVRTHQSLNSAGGKGDLFRAMFPDSAIAQDFNKLSDTKLNYIINHGLAPYFEMQIMQELAPKGPRLPPKFTSCFDESFNKSSYSKQMDVHILYYDENINRVQRVYLGSQFVGHGRAVDIMVDFKKAHKDLDIVHNLIQLSMDGPHVNWAFHRDLEEYRKTEDPDAHSLINIGSCGIHVVHGAFHTGQSQTDWQLEKN